MIFGYKNKNTIHGFCIYVYRYMKNKAVLITMEFIRSSKCRYKFCTLYNFVNSGAF